MKFVLQPYPAGECPNDLCSGCALETVHSCWAVPGKIDCTGGILVAVPEPSLIPVSPRLYALLAVPNMSLFELRNRVECLAIQLAKEEQAEEAEQRDQEAQAMKESP